MTVIVPERKVWSRQQGTISTPLNTIFTRLSIYNSPPRFGFDFAKSALLPFTLVGAINEQVETSSGIGCKRTDSTGHLYRSVSVTPTSLVMFCVFIPTAVNASYKVNYGLGSASTSGALAAIGNGSGSSSNILGQFRGADGASYIGKLGPIPEIGKICSVVFVAPSNLISEAYLYVNGVKYTNSFAGEANTTFGTTLVTESVLALKRSTNVTYNSSDIVLASGFGTTKIDENLAQSLSANPWQIFAPRRQLLYVSATSVQLSYLRPASDITTGSWSPSTGTTLYGVLDEVTADDADYIQASTATGCEIKLSAGSTPTSRDNHTIKYRLLAGSGNIAVVLKCGSTTIKSWNHILTGSAQDFSQALSNAEATNITDYSDLRVTFTSS